jgi:hypothetical protein
LIWRSDRARTENAVELFADKFDIDKVFITTCPTGKFKKAISTATVNSAESPIQVPKFEQIISGALDIGRFGNMD